MILERNALERERIKAGLRELGARPLESVTNFVAADVGVPAERVVRGMRERGVRIASFGYEAAGTWFRISTGTPADTDACIEALAEVLGELRG
jgi:histidinol-phosphate aminotransferase